MELLNAIFWMILVLILLNIGDFAVGMFFNPDIDQEFDRLKTSIIKSDVGTAGSMAKQKKKIESIIGEGIMSQFPVMDMLGGLFPQLPEYLNENKHLAPFTMQLLTTLLTLIKDKVPIPPSLQPLADTLLGGTTTL